MGKGKGGGPQGREREERERNDRGGEGRGKRREGRRCAVGISNYFRPCAGPCRGNRDGRWVVKF